MIHPSGTLQSPVADYKSFPALDIDDILLHLRREPRNAFSDVDKNHKLFQSASDGVSDSAHLLELAKRSLNRRVFR